MEWELGYSRIRARSLQSRFGSDLYSTITRLLLGFHSAFSRPAVDLDSAISVIQLRRFSVSDSLAYRVLFVFFDPR